ncbi:hypothetical protein [Oceanobacillus sp. FSL H7-0719]|uniref:hypothetical protein n=1 Tax=Oceanobacillus sp. FSL H7-0719 TaxID=2954507 RepID=UPI0032502095
MNLYEIVMKHYAPKDSQEGIHTYLATKSDEDVYEWIKKEKELKDGRVIFVSYRDEEDEGETFDLYDDDYNVVGTETFKERIVRLKGDLNDEDKELYDLYYGATLLGWKKVVDNVNNSEVKLLQELGICIEVCE